MKTTNCQKAYNIVAAVLNAIGHHPTQVDRGAIGYFMSAENIKAHIPLEPAVWFKNEKDAFLKDLDEEDSKIALEAIEKIESARSDNELRDVCRECLRVCEILNDKILSMSKPME